MTDKITVPRATWDAMREALKLAMDNLRPHGDNCFLHDVGEYNSCFCGKDSLVEHLHSVVESAALTAANAVNKFAAARSKRLVTDEMLDFDARGLLTSLTFWPHMTEEDSDELAEFLAKHMRDTAANAVSDSTGKQSLHVATGWAAPKDRYAVPVLFNPYTGEPRDVRDVQSDPQGILIVPIGNVEMLAASAVSHAKTETAPVTEGGAITSESAANAVTSECSKVTSEYSEQPQVQGEAYSERFYGSGEDRGWWIVRGGLVKREHVAFLGESVSPEEVSKVVAELNAAHPQATEPAGYKLVPVEPTKEMLYAIQNDCDIMPQRGKRIWATLLAVAPTPPEAKA